MKVQKKVHKNRSYFCYLPGKSFVSLYALNGFGVLTAAVNEDLLCFMCSTATSVDRLVLLPCNLRCDPLHHSLFHRNLLCVGLAPLMALFWALLKTSEGPGGVPTVQPSGIVAPVPPPPVTPVGVRQWRRATSACPRF